MNVGPFTDLRGYLQPPWRADEWLFYEAREYAGGTAVTVPVTMNGQRLFPDGYRGVIAVCDLWACITSGANNSPPLSISNAMRYTLRKNGVPIPAFLNRPAMSWQIRNAYWSTSANFTWENAPGGIPFEVSIKFLSDLDNVSPSLGCFPRLLVPVKLKGGDVLDIVIDPADVAFQTWATELLIQGWMFPASDENEDARGSAADPW